VSAGALALVRHGETADNRAGRLLGRSDPPLTALGRVQARAVARVLAAEGPVAIVSSPLLRARETADAIGDACGVAPTVDERLIEIDYGAWERRPLAEVPRDAAALTSDPSVAFPDGESLVDVGTRVAELCEELLARDGLVVAVSHVSPVKGAVAWALGSGDALAWRMHLSLGSITRLGRRRAGPDLLCFKETGDLSR
jgi:broad specificity phosphatase PhoE